MNDLTGRASHVTCAPRSISKFDPIVWLDAFKETGGSWLVIGDRAHLGYPMPASPELEAMRPLLNEEQAEQVRAQILAGYPAWEA